MRPKILESIHSSTTAAHLGVTKTLEKLRARFYWPGHKKDVSVFVSSCLVCQQRNSPKQKHRHSLVNWPPSFPFAHIGIDFLGPLPISNGNSYIALFVDHFTKWYEAVPLPDQRAETTATALLEHWISRFGVPVSIHTDQGRNFESKFFQSLMQSLQIDKTRTTSFHPQSNSAIERMNRTLLNMLAKSVDDFHSNWTQQLPYVMMAFRTSVHESTGYTPQFLVFGEEINLPLIFSTLRQNSPTRLTCISLFNKNLLICSELTKQHASTFKLLNSNATLCITLKCMAPDASQVTMFGYIVLSPPRD